MNDKWHSFLNNIGAHIDNGMVTNFGNINKELESDASSDIIVDLSTTSIIKVTGEDATNFLHNQLTNDLKALAPGQSQLSGYCSPKGRLLALFRIVAQDDGYLLILPQELATPTLKRLRMFVMMSKVSLEDISGELAHIGLSGPGITSALEQQLEIEVPALNTAATTDSLTIVHVPGSASRFQVFGEVSALIQLWQALTDNVTAVGTGVWERLNIEAGLPVIYKETVEAFVPQMVNLQAVGGLSFTKGCYPGQEVVARMQYLGKLKRRMFIASVESELCPSPGDPIVTPDKEGERKTGQIVAAQPAAGGQVKLIAVIEIASAENSPLHLQSPAGSALKLEALPYSLDD